MKKIRITALVILGALMLCVSGCGKKTVVMREHIVGPGQTLWQIAGQHIKDQDAACDIREFIYLISQANGIKDADKIQPGQVLLIPLGK